jgi:hypothetical protein
MHHHYCAHAILSIRSPHTKEHYCMRSRVKVGRQEAENMKTLGRSNVHKAREKHGLISSYVVWDT